MSSLRLIPAIKNSVFKVYFPKTLITVNMSRDIKAMCLFCNTQQGVTNHEKLKRCYSSRPVTSPVPSEKGNTNDSEEDGLLVKIVKKIPFLDFNKHKMNVVGLYLYESVVDQISYTAFIEEFSLPDTFYSWFCITELHVWLLSVRCMCEDDDGHSVRNSIITAMWADVEQRTKKLSGGSSPVIRKQVQELSEQFRAAIISYDEGLMTDDVTLAGALWRRMYQMRDVDLDHLEILIRYIRRQIIYLDNIPRKRLFSNKAISWDFDRTK